MKTQRGFMSVGILIPIIAGVLIVGGGAYYFYAKKPLKVTSPIKVISPNGGEVVQKGTIQTIRWLYNGSQINRNTRLFIQKGPDENAQFTQSIASVPTTPGQEQIYEWKVPSDFPDGSDYRIQVDLEKNSDDDRLYFDLSDESFVISSNESNSAQNKPVTQNNTVNIDQPSCSDSDNGNDYYIQGRVSFVEPSTMKESDSLQVISSEKVRMRSGEEVALGGVYSSIARDEVYYLKPDNSNGSVLIEMPTRLTIRKINFISAGNQNNGVSVATEINSTDQCVGNVLIENSCVRGINTGYLCAKGCDQGACVR